MGIEERVPEFVEEALRVREVAAGLTGVLKHLPQTAMEQLAMRFNRCQFRSDLENVASLAHDLGEERGAVSAEHGARGSGGGRGGNGGIAGEAGSASRGSIFAGPAEGISAHGAGPRGPADRVERGARNVAGCCWRCWIMWIRW